MKPSRQTCQGKVNPLEQCSSEGTAQRCWPVARGIAQLQSRGDNWWEWRTGSPFSGLNLPPCLPAGGSLLCWPQPSPLSVIVILSRGVSTLPAPDGSQAGSVQSQPSLGRWAGAGPFSLLCLQWALCLGTWVSWNVKGGCPQEHRWAQCQLAGPWAVLLLQTLGRPHGPATQPRRARGLWTIRSVFPNPCSPLGSAIDGFLRMEQKSTPLLPVWSLQGQLPARTHQLLPLNFSNFFLALGVISNVSFWNSKLRSHSFSPCISAVSPLPRGNEQKSQVNWREGSRGRRKHQKPRPLS